MDTSFSGQYRQLPDASGCHGGMTEVGLAFIQGVGSMFIQVVQLMSELGGGYWSDFGSICALCNKVENLD